MWSQTWKHHKEECLVLQSVGWGCESYPGIHSDMCWSGHKLMLAGSICDELCTPISIAIAILLNGHVQIEEIHNLLTCCIKPFSKRAYWKIHKWIFKDTFIVCAFEIEPYSRTVVDAQIQQPLISCLVIYPSQSYNLQVTPDRKIHHGMSIRL